MGVKASQPSLPGVQEFVEYFQNTWMSGRYSPATWNVHEVDEYRTNNHIEGWHSKMRKVVGKAYRNVFELVRVFKMKQASVDVTTAQISAGARPSA